MLIAIIGLGYVGLPLALEFSKKYQTIGFDTNIIRVEELQRGVDYTNQVNDESFAEVASLLFTEELSKITEADIYIVTVPTPIDQNKEPDLIPLLEATKMVGAVLRPGNIVIYESTVYPGCTEEDCVPILESVSGLKFNKDFFCGYSPERINVGDKKHSLTNIIKVTSGSTPEVADTIDSLYASVISAGTHRAPSIKVAEAAKAIENAQRDLNISFVNELALLFDKMGIDTHDVLEAAGSKWNFLSFKPGLVGGHCIGVDPYYLTHKAKRMGYHPEVILSGRKVNEGMGAFVAEKVLALIAKNNMPTQTPKILVLGITFKEDCSDIRNTGVINLINSLEWNGAEVYVYDPQANPASVYKEYSISLQPEINVSQHYDAVILAVAHKEFLDLDYGKWKNQGTIIYDIKAFLDRKIVDARL